MSYDTYYDLLINASVRYDNTKKATIGKRRNVYNTNIDDTYVDHPTACIDHVPNSPYGGIDLPPDERYQVHTLSSRHPPSPRPGNPSRPSFRPQSQHSGPTKPIRRYDGPIFLPPQIYKLLNQDAMKALKAYNTDANHRFHQRKVHNTAIVETPDTFLSMFRLCSCGTKPQRSENHHFVMTSSWEPQCHHDIIMRTPRITGKPKFFLVWGSLNKIPLL